MKKVFIHVGLHRTGSTFLQKHVFPKLDVNFIHVDAKNLKNKFPLKDGKINLISSENFSGSPLNFESKNYGVDERYKLADKLKENYPDAEILLVLRECSSWKKSLYNQYVKGKRYISKEYFNKKFGNNFLNFKEYIKYLENLFGTMNVHVFVYEDLKYDHQRFVNKICRVIGVETPKIKNVIYNKSLTKGQENILHVLRSISDGMIKKIRFGMQRMNR